DNLPPVARGRDLDFFARWLYNPAAYPLDWRPSMLTRIALVPLAAVLALAAGCGDSSTTPTPDLTTAASPDLTATPSPDLTTAASADLTTATGGDLTTTTTADLKVGPSTVAVTVGPGNATSFAPKDV